MYEDFCSSVLRWRDDAQELYLGVANFVAVGDLGKVLHFRDSTGRTSSLKSMEALSSLWYTCLIGRSTDYQKIT